MPLEPPSLWIVQRGHPHRVYWRNAVPGLPRGSHVPFYGRGGTEQFVVVTGLLGLDISGGSGSGRAAGRRPGPRFAGSCSPRPWPRCCAPWSLARGAWGD